MTENAKPLALVIDDQDDIVEIVKLTLQYEGWRVATARNGREGVAAVRQEAPDLILADLMMPEMTGIEFCRRLVEDFKLTDVPVLMISGVNEKAKILGDFWEMPLRHHNFLHKPFTTDELLSAVHSILPRHMNQLSPQAATQPVAAPKPQPAAPAAPSPSKVMAPFKPEAGRGFRILLVDDDDDIRMVMKATLGMFHVIAEACNGMEGLEMVDHFGPDIVISDVNMPLMNGLEMAAAIRRHPAFCAVPIFFLTGETDGDLPRRAYDIGGNLYLRKPIDPVQVLKFIDRFLVEVGLQPGKLHSLAEKMGVKVSSGVPSQPIPISSTPTSKPAAPAPSKPSAPAPAAPPKAVRILIIDSIAEHHHQLRALFEGQAGQPSRVAGAPFELLFANELALALGNLTRWEPDLILHNPRTPGMPDGVAFGQSLRLRKLSQMPEVAFIGDRFLDSEMEYSRRQFNRSVVKLDSAELSRKLSEAVLSARAMLRPKQFPYSQLIAEEKERLRQLQATSAREALQREEQRKRYAGLQAFIDREL